MGSCGSGRPPCSRADADPSHTQPPHRGDLHISASPVVSDRVQEKMINACPAERNEKHGTGRSSPHFWRGKQGQESKEKQSQSPQIHYGVKLSHKHAPANQNEPHHSDTKCIQTLKWHPRGVTFSFSDARDGFPMSPPPCFSALWEGAGMWDWLPGCWESSEPLKAFQECQHRLPACSLFNAHFSCLLRTGCARQAFIQRQRLFWAHEKKAQPFRCEWRDLRSRWLRGRGKKGSQRGRRETKPMYECIPGTSPPPGLER